MGQYHTIYNKTKGESFSIGGAKLLEKACNHACSAALMVLLCNSNGRGGGDLYVDREYDKKTFKALPLKGHALEIDDAVRAISGRWAGDEIVIQGDYAKRGDPSYIGKERLANAKDITDLVLLALEADSYLSENVKQERDWRAQLKKMRLAG